MLRLRVGRLTDTPLGSTCSGGTVRESAVARIGVIFMADETQRVPPVERFGYRFEATVHAADDRNVNLTEVADLDVDRVPDPTGEVRVLVGPDDCVRLLDRGMEVRLHRAVPIRPLDPDLIADDASVRAWFDERIRPTGRSEAP
jgi:hypothetical protein